MLHKREEAAGRVRPADGTVTRMQNKIRVATNPHRSSNDTDADSQARTCGEGPTPFRPTAYEP
jgi:hypothetical protein